MEHDVSLTTRLSTRAAEKAAEKAADRVGDRTVISDSERRRPGIRVGMSFTHLFLTIGLVIAGLGPILWLAKSAVTPTQDTLQQPFALWPNGVDWENLSTAWNDIHIDQYFFNTVIIALVPGSCNCSSPRRPAMRSPCCNRSTRRS